MAGSPFYARIKAQVLQIVVLIPAGRLLTFTQIGDWLDVPARHVAYILSKLSHDEEVRFPWFRVVPASGCVPIGRMNAFGMTQRARLLEEGVVFGQDGGVIGLAERLIPIEHLRVALPRQSRPAVALSPPRRNGKGSY
jgi:methylated-DNA-protein-cysteine methyltransferase related protein